VKYLKQAFLPLREFRSLSEANTQLRQWILAEAGNRLHGTTREQPLALFESVEKAQLLGRLPDVPPELAVWATLKVHRDAHVQFEKAYYSVPFRLLGQTLWLKATADVVRLYQAREPSSNVGEIGTSRSFAPLPCSTRSSEHSPSMSGTRTAISSAKRSPQP